MVFNLLGTSSKNVVCFTNLKIAYQRCMKDHKRLSYQEICGKYFFSTSVIALVSTSCFFFQVLGVNCIGHILNEVDGEGMSVR